MAVAISTLVLEVVSTGIMIYRCLRVQNLIKGASSMPTIYRAIFHDGAPLPCSTAYFLKADWDNRNRILHVSTASKRNSVEG